MANQPVTLSGNLTGPVLLRRTQSGSLVAKFRIAADRSAPDNTDGKWRNFDQVYLDVEAWGDLAYNCKASLDKGAPVWVNGHLVTQQWVSKSGTGEEGKRQSKIVLKARAVAVDMCRHKVIARRSAKVIEHFTTEADQDARYEQFERLIDEDNYRPAGGEGGGPGALTGPASAFGRPSQQPEGVEARLGKGAPAAVG